MEKTLPVCLCLGFVFLGSVFCPMPLQAAVGVAPTSISFGSVPLNTRSTATTIVVTNDGRHDVSILQVSSSLPEFMVIGPLLPTILGSHASTSFQVAFTPDVAQSFSGNIIVSTSRNTSTISVSGTGTPGSSPPPQSYLLSATASSLGFGNILVGGSASKAITLTNTGTAGVNLQGAAVTGAGFTVSGFPGTVTLPAGQSFTLTVSFAPATAGAATGSLSIVSSATNSPATISLGGTGVQPQISLVPASVSFGNDTVGVTSTQSLIIRNSGTANLAVTQATLAGTGFSFSGLTLPLSVPPGGSSAFTVSFTPSSASSSSGSLTLVNNTVNSPLVVVLAGTGVSPILQIRVTPSSLSFGSIATNTSATQSVTLANTGNASVSLSQISASGAGFSTTGLALPLTLAAGQSTSFGVTFAPTTTGGVLGSVTVTSNAANSPAVVSLSGTGNAPVSHSVSLTWTASSSSYAGFNIYRGSSSGGPYTRVNSSLISVTSYTDASVTAGQSYFYVATEEDSTGAESSYSSEISVTIP